MNLHLKDDDLVLHYYGELPAPEESRAESHLGSCAACQANYTKLQRVMAFVDSAPAVEPGPGFERIAWARLEPALHRPRRSWLSAFVFSPVRLAFTAGIGLLVGAAVVAGPVRGGAGADHGGEGGEGELDRLVEQPRRVGERPVFVPHVA